VRVRHGHARGGGKSDAEDEMARFPWDILRCEIPDGFTWCRKVARQPGHCLGGVNEGGDSTNIGGPMSGFTTQGPGSYRGRTHPSEQGVCRSRRRKRPRSKTRVCPSISSMAIISLSSPAAAPASASPRREILKRCWRTSGTNCVGPNGKGMFTGSSSTLQTCRSWRRKRLLCGMRKD